MKLKEVDGDLIILANEGHFDVISHGCNCCCNMSAGIASQMAKAYGANEFMMEGEEWHGEFTKLGNIDYQIIQTDNGFLAVVNSYTQYATSVVTGSKYDIPLDYDALRMCMRKINQQFPNLRIGLPLIGGGLSKGDHGMIKDILKEELIDCKPTLVNYK